jgi:hypothetical protein
VEIDEGSIYRYDYVKLMIACRDATRVPKTAEGTLGLQLIDFGYEREIPDDNGSKVLKSGIVVTEDQQPPAKRTKADIPFMPPRNEGGSGKIDRQGSSHGAGKQVEDVFWFAPPKIDFKPRSQTKLLADAQKTYKNSHEEGEGEKVHIPENFEDSNSDSDSFTVRVQ